MSDSVYEIPVEEITGEHTSLGEFKGEVLLVVNVASKCALTPQYESLEKLYERLGPQGFVVAGFPANDFKEQEPGTNADIQSFCTLNYGVKFPMFGKIAVTGPEKHALYKTLIGAQPAAYSVHKPTWREQLTGWGVPTLPEPELAWNFEKFLVSRSGKVVQRFAPDMTAETPELVAAIESEIAKN